MCRLAYIPRPFDGMVDWLQRLERSCGGHGSGVAIGRTVEKGVDLGALDTAKAYWRAAARAATKKKRIMPALWHTRLASSGARCDDLCHPFECDGGWLVHNGHWGLMHAEAQKIDGGDDSDLMPMSDSRLFSAIVDQRGFRESIERYHPPGVWLHMLYSGELAVWKGSGDLAYNRKTGAWGSKPYEDKWNWVDVERGFYDRGQVPTARAAPPRSRLAEEVLLWGRTCERR